MNPGGQFFMTQRGQFRMAFDSFRECRGPGGIGEGVGWITQDDYDKKARELKERQAEIAAQIEQHQHGDGEYRTTLESLISLASRAIN